MPSLPRLAFGLSLLLASVPAAQNLVPNPGFESYSLCPTTSGQLTRCNSWTNPSGSATPDYMNSCHTSVIVSVPSNAFGSQSAHGGKAYIHLFTSVKTSNYREYAQAKLTSPLSAGQVYRVSFYVSLSDGSKQATAQIGAYLSSTAVSTSFSSNLPYVPQVENPGGTSNIISNKTGWTQVTGTFTASGGEQYITIGNFRNPSNTTVTNVSGLHQGASYYVDDVSVVKVGGTGSAPSKLIGWADLSPYTLGYIDVQDDVKCPPAKTLCRTTNLLKAAASYAGGTAYDPRYRTVWCSDGLAIAEYYVPTGISKACRIRCQPVKAPRLHNKALVSGLACADRQKRLYQLSTAPGHMEIWTHQSVGPCLGKRVGCRFVLPTGALAGGLAYDEITNSLFVAVSVPAATGYQNFIYVMDGKSPCKIVCKKQLNGCSRRLITGLAWDTCKKKLYATDGQITQTIHIPQPRSCLWTAILVCCKKQLSPAWRGLALVPGWTKKLTGKPCTTKPCAPCTTMSIGSIGDPSIGNAFQIRITGAPTGAFGLLYVKAGPCGSGVPLPKPFCGRFYPFPPLLSYPSVVLNGTGTCGGNASHSLPIPLNPSLCGQSLCAQWFVLCLSTQGVGTGLSQGMEFTIATN